MLCIHKVTFDVVVALVSWKARRERQVNYENFVDVVELVKIHEDDVDAVVEVEVVVDEYNLKEKMNERQGIQGLSCYY